MTDTAHLGPVEIRVPPDPSLSRVLRLAASGMASLAGFDVDQIEDIKIAVSEVLIALIEHGAGESVDVQFTSDGRCFEIRGKTKVEHFDAEHPDLILCRTVLAEASNNHGIDLVDHHARIWATIGSATLG